MADKDPWEDDLELPTLTEVSKTQPLDYLALNDEKKMELLINALVTSPQDPLGVIARRMGMTNEELNEITDNSEFVPETLRRSLNFIVGPRIPEVLQRLVDGAIAGSDQKIKMLMQMIDALEGDKTQVNVLSLQNESTDGLLNKLKNLQEQLVGDDNGQEEISQTDTGTGGGDKEEET